jgi:hypothetical protein
VDEPTITEKLRRVAHAAVQDVPGCRAASISVLAHGPPRTVTVSDAVAIEVDVAQYLLNEGPCLEAAAQRTRSESICSMTSASVISRR